MYKQLHNTLAIMEHEQKLSLLNNNHVGIEKESLRVDSNGSLSQQAPLNHWALH